MSFLSKLSYAVDSISKFVKKHKKYIPYMLLAVWVVYPAVILLVLGLIKLVGLHKLIPISYDNLGIFGDLFGGLNALFSGGALAGIIYSIYLQNTELKLQRKEMKKQREEFVENRRVMQSQKFENYFFQELLRLREIRRNIFIKGKHRYKSPISKQSYKFDLYQKNDCWGDFAIMILHRHCNKLSFEINQNDLDKSKFAFLYDNLFYQFLGGYFRVVYNIVKYIDTLNENELSDDEKIRYVHLLRAELSNSELYFLLQTGLSEYGAKFKPLLEKYSMFEHFNNDHETEDRISITYLIKYDEIAFGDNKTLIEKCKKHKNDVDNNPNRIKEKGK